METIPLASPFPGASCLLFRETPSTMDEARIIARGGCPDGTLILADRQTAGRGRLPGRRWETNPYAEPGESLLATLVLGRREALLPGITIRLGLSLVRAIRIHASGLGTVLHEPPAIKWPNDLLLGGLKAGGILCEQGEGRLFVGIGLNLGRKAVPPAQAGRAICLETAMAPLPAGAPGPDRFRFLEQLLSGIARVLVEEDWRAEAERMLWKRGEEVEVLEGLPEGGRLVAGRLEGLAGDGSLLLRRADGTGDVIAAGELRHAVGTPAVVDRDPPYQLR